MILYKQRSFRSLCRLYSVSHLSSSLKKHCFSSSSYSLSIILIHDWICLICILFLRERSFYCWLGNFHVFDFILNFLNLVSYFENWVVSFITFRLYYVDSLFNTKFIHIGLRSWRIIFHLGDYYLFRWVNFSWWIKIYYFSIFK